MRNYNEIMNGSYTRKKVSWAFPATNGIWTEGQGAVVFNSLSSSSSHGNFKTPTPFSFTKEYSEKCRGTRVETRTYDTQTFEGWGLGGDFVNANAFRASALDPHNKCLGKLHSLLRRDIDLSIDLYQGMQTVKMVKDFASLIIHPYNTLYDGIKKHIVHGGWRGSTKLTGSKWLEWQYGLRPTVGTIYDLSNELIGSLISPSGFQLVKARASTRDKRQEVIAYNAAGNYWGVFNPVTVVSEDQRREEMSLTYTIGNPELNALSQFTSLNPVSFFYENIPFSFVLDWAFDVGSYLRMLETSLATGLVFKGGYKTTTRFQKAVVVSKNFNYVSGVSSTTNISGQSWRKSLSRTLLLGMPTPEFPVWNPKLGTERLISAASLLSNLLTLPSKRR